MAALSAALEADPRLAHDLARVQQTACTALHALIEDAAAWLSRQAPAAAPARGGPIDVIALGAMARGRAAAARETRELAEAFVIGALINHGNAAWDPFDPATSRSGADSLLVTVLLAARSGAPDAPTDDAPAGRSA